MGALGDIGGGWGWTPLLCATGGWAPLGTFPSCARCCCQLSWCCCWSIFFVTFSAFGFLTLPAAFDVRRGLAALTGVDVVGCMGGAGNGGGGGGNDDEDPPSPERWGGFTTRGGGTPLLS